MSSPAPRKLNLLSLPPEIVDEIVTEIPSPKTLLALSKSSKSLAALVIPHHLYFRVIRASFLRSHLWERLARDELHAANVHSLTVLKNDADFPPLSPDEYDVAERLPPFPESESEMGWEAGRPLARAQATFDIEIETMLVSALRHMVHLNEFAWYREPSPILTGEDDIWSTLQRLKTVRNLDILDKPSGVNSNGPKKGIIFSDTFLRLSGFTTLKLHSSALEDLDDEPDVTSLIDMLEHNCPDLESLSLSLQLYRHINTASVSHLLSHTSWPRLHTLRLTNGLGCSSASLVQFLKAHPGIEELVLGRMLPGRSWEEFGLALHGAEEGAEDKPVLPRLKMLECSSAQAAALLMRPIETLETLSGVEVHDTIALDDYFSWDDEWEEEHAEDPEEDGSEPIPSPWRDQFLTRLRACPSVRRLGVFNRAGADIRQLDVLATVTPHLTRLDITVVASDLPSDIDIDHWCALYALFPSLHTIAAGHLVNLSPFYFHHMIQKNKDNIQKLARACPRLKVLVSGDWKAVIISRDGVGKEGELARWVVRKVSESEEGGSNEEEIYGS
ncbi:hypothetical protein EW146_g2302 [Bondarzewia mesenterica]|uniref:F-box domain-containing protein n=1 Tax=Bondarzewia mesenterica TaxID=1095465 RepID=A0A4S4M2G7_9AGAM|nr:hypothetical protein EW146_g2302 [Bondarzewia mesenterica]